MSDIMQFRVEAQAFAAEHLAECAAELIEWQDTAILRDGRVRELAAKCEKFISNHDSLPVAESLINRAAVERARAALAQSPVSAEGLTDDQISKGGRHMADHSAEVCNVDKDDYWKIYGQEAIDEFRAAYAAAIRT